MIARLGLGLALLLSIAAQAHADVAAANDCAAKLPPDAKAIYDRTLPQVTPDADMRALLTSNTRSLAMSGTISMGNARDSATAASECLRLARG